MDEQFVRETFPQRLKHYMQIHGKKRTDPDYSVIPPGTRAEVAYKHLFYRR